MLTFGTIRCPSLWHLPLCAILLFAGPMPAKSANLQTVYAVSLNNGNLAPSLDLLGVGPLQTGYTQANTNPTFTPQSDSMLISVTRPVSPVVGPVGAGLFATPVNFDQGSIFAARATFIAPVGPHGATDQWAVTISARTGDNDDLNADTRTAVSFQVRADGARLNAVGAAVPINLPNVPQNIYDSIFNPEDPQPFTLELLVDRILGGGTVTLTVGPSVFTSNYQLAAFLPGSGPAITAIGPTVAVVNGPGQTASVRVLSFEVLSVPEPASWAMMLMGFGAIGVAARHKRKTDRIRQRA